MNEVANVLQNYSQETGAGGSAGDEVASHFQQIAAAAPSSDLAGGLAAMFHSDQTPPFAQMVGQLFGKSDGTQRANLLNTLLTSGAAAGLLQQLTQSAGVTLPAGLGTTTPVTPESAAQITPDMAQQAAARAAQHDPSIVERVSELYAAHPTLVKTLGAAAMSIALSHLAQRRR